MLWLVEDTTQNQFKKHHKCGINEMMKLLKNGKNGIQRLKKPLLRNSFLYCSLKFTKDESIEHLIIGYGKLRGGGTDINAIQHIKGRRNIVRIPNEVILYANLGSIRRSREVIIFHNHPKSWIDNLTKSPIPSSADRRSLLYSKYFNVLQLYNKFLSTGEIKYFLGANGKVIEIKGSSITSIFDILSKT